MNYFVFRSLIRTFAADFNKHVDRFGLLATTEKNAKRKDLQIICTGLSRIPPYFFPHTLLINNTFNY